MIAGRPYFVEQETLRRFDGAMQVVDQAAFFAPSWRDQRAERGFEQGFLAWLGAQDYN